MIQKMLLTFEDAQVLKILREQKKINRKQAAEFLGINETTLHKYEYAKHSIPMRVWEEMKVLYKSSLDGIGEVIKLYKYKNGRPIKEPGKRRRSIGKKNIIPLTSVEEKARNMRAMRSSELDNRLQVHKLLRSLSDVF